MKSVSLKTTTITGLALLGLWVASWALSAAKLGAWSLVIALGIAAVKGALVVLFFMELATERGSIRAVAFTAVVLVAILMSFMLLDIATRATPPLLPLTATIP